VKTACPIYSCFGIGPLFRRSAIPKLCGDWAVAELLVILVSFSGSPYNIVLVLIILEIRFFFWNYIFHQCTFGIADLRNSGPEPLFCHNTLVLQTDRRHRLTKSELLHYSAKRELVSNIITIVNNRLNRDSVQPLELFKCRCKPEALRS